jgi:peptide/nickel transport system substrate-binding protein
MKLKRKVISVLGVLALTTTAVISINPASAATPASWNGPAPAQAGAVKGGTVTIINQGDFEHLDPARNYVGGTLDFYRLFIRSLTSVRQRCIRARS